MVTDLTWQDPDKIKIWL